MSKKNNSIKINKNINNNNVKFNRDEIISQIKPLKLNKSNKETVKSVDNYINSSINDKIIDKVDKIDDNKEEDDIDEESVEYIENVSSNKEKRTILTKLDDYNDINESITPIDMSKYILKDMQSFEDIKDKEKSFKDLITSCKSVLSNMLKVNKDVDIDYNTIMNKTWDETREQREREKTVDNQQSNEIIHDINDDNDNIEIHSVDVIYDENGNKTTISTSNIQNSNERYLDKGVQSLIDRQQHINGRKPSKSNIFIHTTTTDVSIPINQSLQTSPQTNEESKSYKSKFAIGFDVRAITSNGNNSHTQGPVIYSDSARLVDDNIENIYIIPKSE